MENTEEFVSMQATMVQNYETAIVKLSSPVNRLERSNMLNLDNATHVIFCGSEDLLLI